MDGRMDGTDLIIDFLHGCCTPVPVCKLSKHRALQLAGTRTSRLQEMDSGSCLDSSRSAARAAMRLRALLTLCTLWLVGRVLAAGGPEHARSPDPPSPLHDVDAHGLLTSMEGPDSQLSALSPLGGSGRPGLAIGDAYFLIDDNELALQAPVLPLVPFGGTPWSPFSPIAPAPSSSSGVVN